MTTPTDLLRIIANYANNNKYYIGFYNYGIGPRISYRGGGNIITKSYQELRNKVLKLPDVKEQDSKRIYFKYCYTYVCDDDVIKLLLSNIISYGSITGDENGFVYVKLRGEIKLDYIGVFEYIRSEFNPEYDRLVWHPYRNDDVGEVDVLTPPAKRRKIE